MTATFNLRSFVSYKSIDDCNIQYRKSGTGVTFEFRHFLSEIVKISNI